MFNNMVAKAGGGTGVSLSLSLSLSPHLLSLSALIFHLLSQGPLNCGYMQNKNTRRQRMYEHLIWHRGVAGYLIRTRPAQTHSDSARKVSQIHPMIVIRKVLHGPRKTHQSLAQTSREYSAHFGRARSASETYV